MFVSYLDAADQIEDSIENVSDKELNVNEEEEQIKKSVHVNDDNIDDKNTLNKNKQSEDIPELSVDSGNDLLVGVEKSEKELIDPEPNDNIKLLSSEEKSEHVIDDIANISLDDKVIPDRTFSGANVY